MPQPKPKSRRSTSDQTLWTETRISIPSPSKSANTSANNPSTKPPQILSRLISKSHLPHSNTRNYRSSTRNRHKILTRSKIFRVSNNSLTTEIISVRVWISAKNSRKIICSASSPNQTVSKISTVWIDLIPTTAKIITRTLNPKTIAFSRLPPIITLYSWTRFTPHLKISTKKSRLPLPYS